jgi:LysR family nitrogen assimilation transcriptional regulator
MDTRYLRSFLKIAAVGSISRAADSLGVAQPSLSHQLLRLEDEVGASLFRRTARGVTLTEAGRVFQEQARQLLQSAEQAVESIRELSKEATGEAALAVPYSISRIAGYRLFEAFLGHAPKLRMRLFEASTGQIRGWLESGRIDIGIVYDLGPLRHLSFRPLASDEVFLIGPAGKFGTYDSMPSISQAELGRFPLLLPGNPHGMRQFIDQEIDRFGGSLDIRFEVDVLAHIGKLVGAGHGYSILPLATVADELADGAISIARIADGSIRRKLCFARNNTRMVTRASIYCEDITARILSDLIGEGAWMATPDADLS